MTYADVRNGRGSNLRQMDIGDVLLFIAHLRAWEDGEWLKEHGFYLIGGLRIEQFDTDGEPLRGKDAERFRNNADFIRAKESGYWNDNMFFAGGKYSRRFHRAVPLNRCICDKVLRDAEGQLYDWTKQRGKEIRIIGSYTRTCRAVLDTSIPEQARRLVTLRKWIAEHAGAHGAELLG